MQPRRRKISRPWLSVSAISVTISLTWHCWQPASMFSWWCSGHNQNLLYPCAFTTLETAAPLPPWHGVQPNFSGSWILSSSLFGWLANTSSPPIDALVMVTGSRVPRGHASPRRRIVTPNQLNVLLTLGRDGRGTLVPKLADFGLAKAFGVIATPVTQPEQIFGTIKYMGPAPGTTRAFIPARPEPFSFRSTARILQASQRLRRLI